MDFELSSAEKAFRDEVRAWLKTNAPRDDGDLETSEFIDNRRAWQKKLHEAGYVGITWPKEYGGRGGNLMEQLIFNDEMIQAHAPEPINVIGLGMGGPVVMAHGSDEQKKRYLPPLLSGDLCARQSGNTRWLLHIGPHRSATSPFCSRPGNNSG